MSQEKLRRAFSEKTGTPAAKLLLLVLADMAPNGRRAIPTVAQVEARTGLTTSQVADAVFELERLGMLKVERLFDRLFLGRCEVLP